MGRINLTSEFPVCALFVCSIRILRDDGEYLREGVVSGWARLFEDSKVETTFQL